MPQANVWIRKENWAKWEAMADKSLWLNTLLANADDTTNYGKTIKTPVGPAVTVLSETLPPEPLPNSTRFSGANLCKVHGLPLTLYGKCLQKGCKYA